MVELVATIVITVSSMALFGYWVRCAWRLLRFDTPRFDNPLPKATNAAENGRELLSSAGRGF